MMGYYGGWKPYIPVAQRRARAARQMEKLKKKGIDIQPVTIEKRKIARSFWGSGWCEHIESFSDFANRLPRGRTYVRNGSVCHLAINKGEVEAIVSGSSLYHVCVNINILPQSRWGHIKSSCAGEINSLIDLLTGQLSDGVMQVVSHRQKGVFPLPGEISFDCDCPDWASMCKHVAAVLYGVGARLDNDPDKLFLLRGVEHEELVDVSAAIIDATESRSKQRKRISDSALSGIFNIDLPEQLPVDSSEQPTVASVNNKPQAKRRTKTKSNKRPSFITGAGLHKKRKQLKMTQAEMAKKLGVSAASISQWERKNLKHLNLKESVLASLYELW